MKATLSIVAVVAAVASLAPTVAVAQSTGTSVVVIDVQQVFDGHLRFKAEMDNIRKDAEGFENFVRGERDKIIKIGDQMKQFNQDAPEYRRLEEQAARQTSDLQVQIQLKRKEMLDREAKLYYTTYQEVQQTVSTFADKYGIGLVLKFSSEPIDPQKRDSVLKGVNRNVVFQRDLNITKPILAELNKGYQPARVPGPQIPR